MTLGTKSLLAVRPASDNGRPGLVSALGIPWDPRLWLCFAFHDVGYFGCSDLDGPSGQNHVELGPRIVHWMCGPEFADECYRHSREWSRRMGRPVSRLCLADKMAFVLTPWWLYLPMAKRTGELAEYMNRSRESAMGFIYRGGTRSDSI